MLTKRANIGKDITFRSSIASEYEGERLKSENELIIG
jgi:hypothetical protein|tara:strand:+ start:162 stop:272 length:111 start_codon:yes stop_codon:yes gene_type:complete